MMITRAPHPIRVRTGWPLVSGAAMLLAGMALYAISSAPRSSSIFQLTVVMLVTGGAVLLGLVKFRNR